MNYFTNGAPYSSHTDLGASRTRPEPLFHHTRMGGTSISKRLTPIDPISSYLFMGDAPRRSSQSDATIDMPCIYIILFKAIRKIDMYKPSVLGQGSVVRFKTTRLQWQSNQKTYINLLCWTRFSRPFQINKVTMTEQSENIHKLSVLEQGSVVRFKTTRLQWQSNQKKTYINLLCWTRFSRPFQNNKVCLQ